MLRFSFVKSFFSLKTFLQKNHCFHQPFSRFFSQITTKKQNSISLLSFLNLENRLKSLKISCKGCGVKLQIESKEKAGFIDAKVLQSRFSKEISSENRDISKENLENDEFSEETNNVSDEKILKKDINLLEKESFLVKKPLFCERCHSLKFSNSSQNELSEEKELKSLDLEAFIVKIYEEIKPFSLILYLIDLSNVSATIIPRLLRLKKEKKCQIWLIVNKIDILPKDYDILHTKHNLRKLLEKELGEFPQENLFYVSSLTGAGFDKLIRRLKPKNTEENDEKTDKKTMKFRKAYVIGCTNTGKSTFINQLLKFIKPKNYSFYHNPYEKNQKLEELTTSNTPNTTLKINEIEHIPLKYKLFDTPGIPNEVVLGALMSRLLQENRGLIIKKRIKPEILEFEEGKSIWCGGLVRIDFPRRNEGNEGQRVIVHVYCSYEVSLHKTLTEKANELYIKHYNNLLTPVYDADIKKVTFKKHEISLKIGPNGECEEILEIFGFGWLRFSLTRPPPKENIPLKIPMILYLGDTVIYKQRETMMSIIPKTRNLQGIIHDKKLKRRERTQKVSRRVVPLKKA